MIESVVVLETLNLVHRDMNLDNFLVTDSRSFEELRIGLFDFGRVLNLEDYMADEKDLQQMKTIEKREDFPHYLKNSKDIDINI